jgi:hypothetical protein
MFVSLAESFFGHCPLQLSFHHQTSGGISMEGVETQYYIHLRKDSLYTIIL